jgi:hypothetical protein
VVDHHAVEEEVDASKTAEVVVEEEEVVAVVTTSMAEADTVEALAEAMTDTRTAVAVEVMAMIVVTVSAASMVAQIAMVVRHVTALPVKIAMVAAAEDLANHAKIAMEVVDAKSVVAAVVVEATMAAVKSEVTEEKLHHHAKTEIHMPAAVAMTTVVMTAILAEGFPANLVRTQTRVRLEIGSFQQFFFIDQKGSIMGFVDFLSCICGDWIGSKSHWRLTREFQY